MTEIFIHIEIYDMNSNLIRTVVEIAGIIFFSIFQVDEDDGLPTQICKKCVNNVNNWYAFKKICEDSQQKLQNWLNGDGSGESVNTTDLVDCKN